MLHFATQSIFCYELQCEVDRKRGDVLSDDAMKWVLNWASEQRLLTIQVSVFYLSSYFIWCLEKKRPKCFLVISSTKLWHFWCTLIHSVLNKFATESCKRFPPSPELCLYTTLWNFWNDHCARATIKLLEKETPYNLSHLSCGLQICQIWIELITVCEEYCKRRCTKHTSLIWMNGNSDWEQSEPSWITSSLRQPFVIGIVAYQHVSRPVVDIISTISDFCHCTVSDFCSQTLTTWTVTCYMYCSPFLHIVCSGIVM